MTFEAFQGHLHGGSFWNARKYQVRLNSLEICDKNSDTVIHDVWNVWRSFTKGGVSEMPGRCGWSLWKIAWSFQKRWKYLRNFLLIMTLIGEVFHKDKKVVLPLYVQVYWARHADCKIKFFSSSYGLTRVEAT